MDHEYWEEKLQGFLDNELEPADRTVVQGHIEGCEACKGNLAYFSNMKRRLHAHGQTIEAPPSVLSRLEHQFAKKRNPLRRHFVPAAMALAAALVLFFLVTLRHEPTYQFVEKVMLGKVVCHDCAIAARAGLANGEICKEGHRLGLETASGELWRFAADDEGRKYITNLALVGKKVRIFGQVLDESPLIRIKKLETISDVANDKASFGSSRPEPAS